MHWRTCEGPHAEEELGDVVGVQRARLRAHAARQVRGPDARHAVVGDYYVIFHLHACVQILTGVKLFPTGALDSGKHSRSIIHNTTKQHLESFSAVKK